MADYFTLASLVGATELTEDEITWIEDEIEIEATLDELTDDERKKWAEERGFDDPDEGFGFLLSIEKHSDGTKFMWLTHDENFNTANACGFLQHWIRSVRPTNSVSFEYSHTCSKARLDAFGGGAAYITKDEIRYLSTHEWMSEQEGKG